MKILKNLRDYNYPNLNLIEIETRKYKTNLNFPPSTIVVPAFGSSEGLESYNCTLAQSVLDARTFFNKNLLAIIQNLIVNSFNKKNIQNYRVACADWKEKNHPNTQQILQSFQSILEQEGLDAQRILYACHPAHTYRIMEIGKQLGLTGAPFITENVSWPKQDPQKRVHSALSWIPREILVRVHHKIKKITD